MSLKTCFLAILISLLAQFPLWGQNEADLTRFQRLFGSEIHLPPEKLLDEATLKLEQAREIHDAIEETNALKTLGLIHLNQLHDYEQAMDYFIRALSIEDSLNLESQQALTYVAIARVFEVVGDYYKSRQFLSQALKFNENERDINSLAMILINLGKVNASLGNLTEALDNYEQVLRHKEDISRSFEAEALFHVAHLYQLQGKYSNALKVYKQALVVTRSVANRSLEALFLNDIGILYALMKNEAKSLANHEAALGIRQSLDEKSGMAESMNNIGGWYYRQGDMEKVISAGKTALGYGQESQSQDQILKSYELLSQAYKNAGDFENSLRYKELSLAIHEFIQNERHERQLLETQNRYVVEKKESEIDKLQALRIEREREIEAQKRFRNILFLMVALIMVIALLVFYLYLVKRRSNRVLDAARVEVQQQNERLQQLNHTKDKFFSIISHDLKGPLNSLTSFSHLLIEHTDSMSREEIQMLAKDLDKSVKNLFTLLENLLEWSRSQTGNIVFTPEVFDLAELLENNKNLLVSQARNKKITIIQETAPGYMVRLHKHSINTVIRNLISNAIKFTPEGGTIRVGVETKAAFTHIYVADDGLGMSQEVVDKLFRIDTKLSTRGTANEKGTGLGLILCREFVRKNGGKISVQSRPGKGSVFSITFPLKGSLPARTVAENATIS